MNPDSGVLNSTRKEAEDLPGPHFSFQPRYITLNKDNDYTAVTVDYLISMAVSAVFG